MSGYIGTQPVPQATQTRDSFTATSNQTSFATSGYTPNFLDVFLNGVKLAAADYTASNGSDVVLATGATTGDILEVVAYTNFDTANVTGAANFTVTGSFTSQGIDDNATSTAMTLDGSGSLLVGKASSGSSVRGSELRDGTSGFVATFKSDAEGINVDRSTDGSLINLRKAGTSVGNIAVTGTNDLTLYSTATGHKGLRLGQGYYIPTRSDGAPEDNTVDIGLAGYRFKDLYLSGGVFLGGTGSANKLEDYEFGSWNPTYTSSSTDPTFSPNLQNGEYTKIGRMVYASFRLRGAISGTKTGNLRLSGLPFTANSSPANGSGGVGLTENFGASNYPTNLRVNQSATYINLTVYDQSDPRQGLFTNVTVTSTSGSSSGNYIIGHVVYQTD